jgi:hypothetical protein
MKLSAMTPAILLRIAAAAALLLGVGHSFGRPWTPVAGLGERVVLDAMQMHQFTVMGATRSYWDFYVGFGWSIAAYLIAQAIVLWQLAALSNVDARRVRPIVVVFLACTLATGAIAWKFILAIPVVFSLVLAVLLALAVWACGRDINEAV